jgi:hypothetical protein
MGVSDRIMQDVNARYDPSEIVDAGRIMPSSPDEAQYNPPGVDRLTAPSPPTIESQQHRENLLRSFRACDFVAMGVLLVRMLEEKELADEGEWRQLQMALLADKGRND